MPDLLKACTVVEASMAAAIARLSSARSSRAVAAHQAVSVLPWFALAAGVGISMGNVSPEVLASSDGQSPAWMTKLDIA